MGRECRIICAAGKRGCGKSVETIRMIDEYVMGNPALKVHPRRALIFDVNDEFSDFWYYDNPHRRIPAISIKDIEKFSIHPKIEVRRIRPFWDDGRRMTLDDMGEVLTIILDTYRNGLLLVEDINKYVSDSLKTDLVGALATARHIGLDVIMHFQNVGRIAQPKLMGNMNMVRLHKTNDTVSRHAQKLEEKIEIFQLAENIINHKFLEEGNQRYFLYVDVEYSKVKGDFSEDDITRSIEEYISNNKSALVKPYISMISLDTLTKKYTEQTAIKAVADRLRKTYFE